MRSSAPESPQRAATPSTLGPPSVDHAQPIQADYYNIIDEEGWPVAALVVLTDHQREPVRAELHLYEELSDDTRAWAFRHGRAILEARYYSVEPVPLKVFESFLGGETVQVRATGANRLRAGDQQPWFQRWQIAAAAAVLVLLVALVWALASFLRGPGDAASPSAAPAAQGGQPAGEVAPGTTEGEQPGTGADPGEVTFPPSQHADPALGIGKRIRVRPGLRLSLVAEPGPDKGVVGYMQDQQEATITDGPAFTQGTRDTIVWWRVRLDEGGEAWAPANTSDGPVLEAVD
ncbi:MAG: hypothetical protein KJZ93_25150 [Caldilineaceae bacterium]|nr:hypothetical protein [Caldilineaceae bacterium]